MKFAIFVAVAGALSVSQALAQTATPSIAVTGEATISAPPDIAQIDGGVSSDAKTAREAAETNNKAMSVVLLALKTAGVAEKDIQTSRLSLQPQYAPNKGGPLAITGFRASNRVTVTVRDVARASNLLDALVTSGANEIGGIAFMVTNASKLLDEARPKAIADARRKAEIYASAAGISLGAPLSISEESASPPPAVVRKTAAGVAASAPIAQGEETLRVSVSVIYELKPKAQ